MVVLAIILVAPLVLNHLKIPTIIGMIIAGVVVGPHGFNILARDMSFEVFGQVGILYLMFLAGLEIDMYHLKKNMGRGLVFGLFTFFIPLGLGAVGAHYLLHLDWLTSVLMAAMFAAHTLIGYPIVARFGLTRSPAVIITVAGTIVCVLGSLIVLASVVGIYSEGAFNILTTLALLGRLVLYCLGVKYIYPRLTRWFFKLHIDPIVQFVYVLAMVFFAAWVAKMIGLEGVFGAFFAGITLNRYIPAKSSLMARIEFVGNAIFIPYFLIGVGMLINVRVITGGWTTLYVATVMSAIAIACKWLAAFATQVTFSMGRIDRSVMYQLSNAHTAVALAVVMIGYKMGVFSETILNGTILMILVTCTVSSLGCQRAAGRLVLRSSDGDDGGTAGSDASARRNRLADEADRGHTLISLSSPATAKQLISLAILMDNGASRRDAASNLAKLYALHVRSDNEPSSRAIGRNCLDVARQTAAAIDLPITTIERYDLNVITGVINTIAERDISTIFIGLHRRSSVIDSFYGSKIEQLLRTTNRMVVMSRLFIPLNTVTRILVVVPEKAQFETGFRRWVEALGNLTRQVGCRLRFYCHPDTVQPIAGVLYHGRFGIRYDFEEMEHADDYVLLANKIERDDLLVMVSARRASMSFSTHLDDLAEFLRNYFAQNNVMVIYPEQFGRESDIPTMAHTMTTDIISTPSPLYLRFVATLRSRLRRK